MNHQINNTSSNVTAYFPKRKLIIPYTVSQKMLALCRSNDYTEFQWFLESTIIPGANGSGGAIKLTEDSFAFPKQTVASTVVVSTPDDMAEMLEKNEGVYNVWCHSHVDMVCRPSNRDMTDIREQVTGLFDPEGYVIMLITNKRGECYAEYHQQNFSYPMEIVIEGSKLYEDWASDISETYINVEPVYRHPKKHSGFVGRDNTKYNIPGRTIWDDMND